MVSREQREQSTKFGTFIEHSEKLDQSAQTKKCSVGGMVLGEVDEVGLARGCQSLS